MSKRIPILFCIDAEPDVRKVEPDARLDWVGFEKSFEFFQQLRPKLAAATGARANFSWFLRMDPQISRVYGSADWVVTRYRDLIDELEAAGDEIGLHAHAWRWDEPDQDWIADFANQDWVDHCIRLAFDAFQKSFNRPCRSFRFGDHWMNERSLDLLERLGTHFDLTLEPGQAVPTLLPDERFTGTFPDCKRISQTPYRPSKTNFTRRGLLRKRDLWLVPVSAERTQPVPLSQQRPSKRLFSNPKNHEIYVTLNLAFSRTVFSTIADRLLSSLSHPLLVVVARTDILLVPEQRTNLEQNIEYLLSHPLIEKFVFETPAAAVRSPAFLSAKMGETEDTEASMDVQLRHERENHATSSRSPPRPRILFVVDRPNWAHDFKTENLKRVLGNDFEILKCYQSDVTEEDLDQADLILVYYWLQLERLPHLADAFRRNRNRLLVGVTSNWELEAERREPGFAFLQEFASAVFVNNLSLYRECEPVLKIPVFYTPNGVDTRFYHPPVVRQAVYPVRVGWAGSLTNREAGYRGYHDVIVPAVAAVEGMELVTAACEELWRGPEEMRDFYQSLDVYVCASHTDGTPNPCLEAAACGVPLLTTRVGNMPELLRDGVNGFFIERDAEDLKQKLCLLRDNSALRQSLGQRIHEDIKSWDWTIQSQAYRQMFEETLKTVPFNSVAAQVTVDSKAGVNGHLIGKDRKAERVKEALIAKARRNVSLIPATFFENQREPEVTIVMLSYGRSDMTLNAVRALRDNVRIPFKLLLIDNNSGDEVQKQLAELNSKYEFLDLILLQENLGCTRGRMDALQFVKTAYVMFLDNDIEVLPGALEHLLYSMKLHPEITAATGMAVFPDGLVHVSGGNYWPEDGVLYYDLTGAAKPFDDPAVPPSGRCHWVNASMTMYRTSVLLERPFDRSLDFTKRGYYEDLEWSYRLNQTGAHRFERVIESIGIHYHEPVLAGDPVLKDRRQHAMKYVEGIAYFYKKHGMIIQNLFDFIPEFRSSNQLTLQSVRIFLELVNSRGGEWVLDRWNNDQLAPLFLAPSLLSELADKEQTLGRMTNSIGGRLLTLYGKIKYPYLLPVYRLLRLMPPEASVTPKKTRTE